MIFYIIILLICLTQVGLLATLDTGPVEDLYFELAAKLVAAFENGAFIIMQNYRDRYLILTLFKKIKMRSSTSNTTVERELKQSSNNYNNNNTQNRSQNQKIYLEEKNMEEGEYGNRKASMETIS